MSEKLKPCPNCGGPTELDEHVQIMLLNRAFVLGRNTTGSYNEADAVFRSWLARLSGDDKGGES